MPSRSTRTVATGGIEGVPCRGLGGGWLATLSRAHNARADVDRAICASHDSVLIDAVAETTLRRHIDHSLVDFDFLNGVQNREPCALATDYSDVEPARRALVDTFQCFTSQ